MELKRVSRSVFAFSNHIYVVNPVMGKVRFDLYPYQIAVLHHFLTRRFNIILKFRQAGLTELIAMFCLWFALYHTNKNILLLSIKDRVAKKVLRRIKYMYRNLPDYLKVPIVNGRTGELGTSTEMVFSNGSSITSLPTSEDVGRSEPASLFVIDEAAIVRWIDKIWAALFPTISCLTPDSKILVRKGNKIYYEKLGNLAPKKVGVKDLEKKNLEAFTHKGRWQKINYSVNKGKQETWKVVDERGNILKGTPAHRLYTTHGWKTLKEVIEQNLSVIKIDTKLGQVEKPEKTKPPKKEKIKPIKGFDDFYVSNLGKVYKFKGKRRKEIKQRISNCGYSRVALRKPGVYRNSGSKSNKQKPKDFRVSVHKLVYETFIGKIPEGYQVDHINSIRTDNYVTNLQKLSRSENVSKSFKESKSAVIGSVTGKKMPNLILRGKMIEKHQDGKSIALIKDELENEGFNVSRKYIGKCLKHKTKVYITRLKVVKRYKDLIVDINVDQDNSYFTNTDFINHNTGGSAIVNSTPFGIGGWYHKMWVDAMNKNAAGMGVNDTFNPIRLYWKMHPDRWDPARDAALGKDPYWWYNMMATNLGPRRLAQEVDGDFLSSGYSVFDLTEIKEIEECLSDYPVIETHINGSLRVFEKPKKDYQYYLGADVATGRAGDSSAFTLGDRYGDEAVIFKGKIPPNKFAELIGDWGMKYNRAIVAPESNDIGLAVTNKLQDMGYPNIYLTRAILKEHKKRKPKVEKLPGWYTTSKNRPVIIDGLEQDIRNNNIIVKDPYFVTEAYTFIYDESNRPVAMNKNRKSSDEGEDDTKYDDDAIMGKAIYNHIRKGQQKSPVVLPR